MQHTKEPWSTEYRGDDENGYAQEIFDSQGKTIATLAWYQIVNDSIKRHEITTNREENARRIVLCVNADEVLAGARLAIDNFKARIEQLEKQRNELLEVMKEIADSSDGEGGCYYTNRHNIRIANGIIKQIEANK